MDLSSALPEQRDFIVRPAKESALLAAGPGTGKTWVLERRSEMLVEAGVEPERIVVVTLTRSLAADLNTRIPHGEASTLHSFSLRHLNALGDAWGHVVVNPWEQRKLVEPDLALGYRLAYEENCSIPAVKRFLKKLSSAFRDNQEVPAVLTDQEQRLRQVFLQQREVFGYRLLDELAYDLVRLLEVGATLVTPPTHLLVDEYQDLTAGELRLLQLLQEKEQVVINAAGDDRQSIYGFREADPLALHRFPEAYGSGEPNYLWRSSRCPRVVCNVANAVAAALPPLPGLERPDLEQWPGREDEGRVTIGSFPSPIAEARHVAQACAELLANGVEPRDIIVVIAGYYAPVMHNLVEAATAIARPDMFFDPRLPQPELPVELRLAATCARLLLKADDHMAWRTLVWATPGLGEGRQVRIFQSDAHTYTSRLRLAAETDKTIGRAWAAGDAVIDQFGDAETVQLREVVALAAAKLGLTVDLRHLDALSDEPLRPADVARAILELDAPAADDDELLEDRDAIAVHTIFSSKGLQARHVFLVNAATECFAGRGDPANGLRLAYVAITRASGLLRISAPRYLRYTPLGNEMGVYQTHVADFLEESCRRAGVELEVF